MKIPSLTCLICIPRNRSGEPVVILNLIFNELIDFLVVGTSDQPIIVDRYKQIFVVNTIVANTNKQALLTQKPWLCRKSIKQSFQHRSACLSPYKDFMSLQTRLFPSSNPFDWRIYSSSLISPYRNAVLMSNWRIFNCWVAATLSIVRFISSHWWK